MPQVFSSRLVLQSQTILCVTIVSTSAVSRLDGFKISGAMVTQVRARTLWAKPLVVFTTFPLVIKLLSLFRLHLSWRISLLFFRFKYAILYRKLPRWVGGICVKRSTFKLPNLRLASLSLYCASALGGMAYIFSTHAVFPFKLNIVCFVCLVRNIAYFYSYICHCHASQLFSAVARCSAAWFSCPL